jgi:hypothetical protein
MSIPNSDVIVALDPEQSIPQIANPFQIPPYNDVELQYANSSFPTKPTEIIFKQNGTSVYYLQLFYDANGALTRISQD